MESIPATGYGKTGESGKKSHKMIQGYKYLSYEERLIAIRRYQHQKNNEVGSTGTSQPRKAKEEMDGHDSRGPEISRPETR